MSLKEIDVYSKQWIAKAIINLRIVMQKERCKKLKQMCIHAISINNEAWVLVSIILWHPRERHPQENILESHPKIEGAFHLP